MHEPTREELLRTMTPFRKKVLLPYVQSLPQGAKLLDVGCGAGKTLRIIHAFRPDIEITGLDVSNVEELLPEYVKFVKATVEEGEDVLEAGYFDAVICEHLIEHLNDPTSFMRLAHHALTPGGTLFIETPNWTRLFMVWSPRFFYSDYTHVRPFSPFTLYRLVTESDFSPILIRSFRTVPFFIRHRPVIKKNIRTTEPFKRGAFSKIASRVIDPFIPDVSVCIAAKRKLLYD